MQRELRSRSRSRLEEGGEKYQENDSRLQAFREQYPVDDRAFDFLQKAPPAVQDRVITDFRPQSQGQDDYSALLTIFVKKVRGRWERGSRGSDKFHRRHASREAAAEHAVAGRRGRSRTRHGGPCDLESDSDGHCSVVEAARARSRAAPLEDVVDSLCASDAGCSHSPARGRSSSSSSSDGSGGSSSTDNDDEDNKAKGRGHQIELLKDAALQEEQRRVMRAKGEARRAAEHSIAAGMAEAEREMQEQLHEYTAMLQDRKQEKIDHITALAEQSANEQIKHVEDDARLERMEKIEAAEAMAEEVTRAKLEEKERVRNDKRLQKELRRMKASKQETEQKEKRESKRKSEKHREVKRKHRDKGRLGAGRVRGSRERRRFRKLKRRHVRDRGDRGDRDRGRVRGGERAAGSTREATQRRWRGRESRGRDSRDRGGRDDSRGSRDGSFRDRGSRDYARTRRREARGGLHDAEFEAFKERYPMDARAFATLTSAPPEVQNVVLSRFKPRSEGDDDYSALVMTFVRAIINRRDTGGTGGVRRVYRDARHGREHQEEQPQERVPPRRGRGGSDAHDMDGGDNDGEDCCSEDRDASPVTNFRLRYPMDDRAFASLQQAHPQVQDVVLSDFKPRREGDDDYSALVMSFVRAVQTRVGAGRPPTTKGSARQDSHRE